MLYLVPEANEGAAALNDRAKVHVSKCLLTLLCAVFRALHATPINGTSSSGEAG